MKTATKSLPFLIPTEDLAEEVANVVNAVNASVTLLAARMVEHGLDAIKLTKPVGYTDPDAERPEIGSVRLNEEREMEAVGTDDSEITFALGDMDPATVLAILEALPPQVKG